MFQKSFRLLMAVFFLIGMIGISPTLKAQADTVTVPLNCRVGITSPTDATGIDLLGLRISSFLNWGVSAPSNLPSEIDFVHVVRVGDRCRDTADGQIKNCADATGSPPTPYAQSLVDVAALVPTHLGAYWEIGNEPDAVKELQDKLTAEEYAVRFYTLATLIRSLDPTSKISFGTVVQPTPIRLRYLDRSWAKLVELAGGVDQASSLVDFWTIHAFILNEEAEEWSWGAGVPLGFENDHADAIKITNLSDTYSISIFSQRLRNFRTWMAAKGQQDKPLWITEYGSLLPPIDPPGGPNFVNVSDTTTRNFMLKTFDFMLQTADGATGLPSDNYHLVQRWFWYSLNDYRYNFGGSWFDPSKTPPALTTVGKGYVSYTPKNIVKPEFHFGIDAIGVVKDADNFTFNFNVNNSGTSMQRPAKIWVYYDNPSELPVSIIDTAGIMGCGGSLPVEISLAGVPASVGEVFFRLDTNADNIPNVGDEIKSITVDSDHVTRSPANLSTVKVTRPTFTWDSQAGATGYTLQVSLVDTFKGYVLNLVTKTPNYTMTKDLPTNHLLFWRWRPVFGTVLGTWSPIWQFTSANPPKIPTLVSPVNKSLNTNYLPKLDWTNSSTPLGTVFGHYELQIATNNTFTARILIPETLNLAISDFTPPAPLTPNMTFYWRVRAWNDAGQYSGWSSVRSFRTAVLPPTLLTPVEGTPFTNRRPTLDWGDVSGATGYYVQISRYLNFRSTVKTASIAVSTYTPTSDLPAATLYWRVQSKALNGPSAYSEIRSFTITSLDIPGAISPAEGAVTDSSAPLFSWNLTTLPDGTEFAYYQVQVALDDTFAAPILDVQQPGMTNTEFAPSTELTPGTKYYWHVRAFNTIGQYSDWSDTLQFQTPPQEPGPVIP